MRDLPKSIKRVLRELNGLAHERELQRALGDLEAQFRAWRSGEIDCWELKDRIHRFHDGTARDLWKAYNDGDPAANVAVAVQSGVLQREEIPAEALEALRGWLEWIDRP